MIEIGGENRPVKFNFNAFEELDEMGFKLLNGFDIKTGNAAKFTKAIVYVGLKYGLDETGEKKVPFTIGQVGAWIKQGHLEKFLEAMKQSEEKTTAEPGESLGASSKESHLVV